MWLYILVIKSFLVYVSDIFTAVTMLSSQTWSNAIYASCSPTEHDGCVVIQFNIAKWLFVGCIFFSFLLLAYETRKSKKIIASRDISYAFTNIMANNYYSLRSYDHFCFFCHINDSTKTADNFAFFIFFTFKDWKRLLLADGPRQGINALTLYSFYLSKRSLPGDWWSPSKYFSSSLISNALMVSILFTVLIYIGSMLLLIVAAICYVPLLCAIRGNLKEYCCHKVDKRISEIVKRKAKQRLQKQAALAKKEAAGDFSHLRNRKGELIANPLPQPTLPNVSLDDELESRPDSYKTYQYPGANDFYQSDYKSEYQASVTSGPEYGDYPPMPMYPYGSQTGFANYGASAPTLNDGQGYDAPADYDYNGNAYLTQGPAPVGRSSPRPPQYPQYDQRDAYQADNSRYAQPQGGHNRRSSGLAYDEEPAYDAISPPQSRAVYPQQQQQQQSRSPDQVGRGYDRGYGF